MPASAAFRSATNRLQQLRTKLGTFKKRPSIADAAFALMRNPPASLVALAGPILAFFLCWHVSLFVCECFGIDHATHFTILFQVSRHKTTLTAHRPMVCLRSASVSTGSLSSTSRSPPRTFLSHLHLMQSPPTCQLHPKGQPRTIHLPPSKFPPPTSVLMRPRRRCVRVFWSGSCSCLTLHS